MHGIYMKHADILKHELTSYTGDEVLCLRDLFTDRFSHIFGGLGRLGNHRLIKNAAVK